MGCCCSKTEKRALSEDEAALRTTLGSPAEIIAPVGPCRAALALDKCLPCADDDVSENGTSSPLEPWGAFRNKSERDAFIKSALMVLSANGSFQISDSHVDLFINRAIKHKVLYRASLAVMDHPGSLVMQQTVVSTKLGSTKRAAFQLLVIHVEQQLEDLLKTKEPSAPKSVAESRKVAELQASLAAQKAMRRKEKQDARSLTGTLRNRGSSGLVVDYQTPPPTYRTPSPASYHTLPPVHYQTPAPRLPSSPMPQRTLISYCKDNEYTVPPIGNPSHPMYHSRRFGVNRGNSVDSIASFGSAATGTSGVSDYRSSSAVGPWIDVHSMSPQMLAEASSYFGPQMGSQMQSQMFPFVGPQAAQMMRAQRSSPHVQQPMQMPMPSPMEPAPLQMEMSMLSQLPSRAASSTEPRPRAHLQVRFAPQAPRQSNTQPSPQAPQMAERQPSRYRYRPSAQSAAQTESPASSGPLKETKHVSEAEPKAEPDVEPEIEPEVTALPALERLEMNSLGAESASR